MQRPAKTSRKRNFTILFLVLFCLLLAGGALLGIDDNPPGIILVFLAGGSLTAAFVHPWRVSARFKRLLWVSALLFFSLLVVGAALSILVDTSLVEGMVTTLLGALGTIFLLAVPFLFLPMLLISLVGFIITKHREHKPGESEEESGK